MGRGSGLPGSSPVASRDAPPGPVPPPASLASPLPRRGSPAGCPRWPSQRRGRWPEPEGRGIRDTSAASSSCLLRGSCEGCSVRRGVPGAAPAAGARGSGVDSGSAGGRADRPRERIPSHGGRPCPRLKIPRPGFSSRSQQVPWSGPQQSQSPQLSSVSLGGDKPPLCVATGRNFHSVAMGQHFQAAACSWFGFFIVVELSWFFVFFFFFFLSFSYTHSFNILTISEAAELGAVPGLLSLGLCVEEMAPSCSRRSGSTVTGRCQRAHVPKCPSERL